MKENWWTGGFALLRPCSTGTSTPTTTTAWKSLYDWIDANPGLECSQLHVINNPAIIAQNDHLISINA